MNLGGFRLLIYILDPYADTFWPPVGGRPSSQEYSFDRVAVIEEYESCIWTERFIEAGDFKLTTVATGTNAKLLQPGIVLENDRSSLPMLIETVELKDDQLIASGRTIETFFNQRVVGPEHGIVDTLTGKIPRVLTDSPGRIMAAIVDIMQQELVIYGVRSGLVQADGDDVTKKLPKYEPVHDLLLRIAKQYVVDMYVRRNSIEYGGYEFIFSTRKGVRRVDGNLDGYPTVRFTPKDDNLVNTTQLYSAINTVAAVIVYPPEHWVGPGQLGSYFSDDDSPFVIHEGNIDNPMTPSDFNDYMGEFNNDNNSPFNNQSIVIIGEKLTVEYLETQFYRYPWIGGYTWDDLNYAERHNLCGLELIRLGKYEYNRSRGNRKWAIDGEVASNVLKYRRDYYLGDIVEVIGRDYLLGDGTEGPVYVDHSAIFGKREAVVSEYIYSADATGIREYPTFAEPLKPALYDDSPDEQATIGPNRRNFG